MALYQTLTSSLQRILALVVKELQVLLSDPKAKFILFAPPLMQLFIFSFAATLEVKNVHLAILNYDTGHYSKELIQDFVGSPYFTSIYFTQSRQDMRQMIDNEQVVAAMVIPQDFSRKLERKETADVQLIMDGRRSNSAQIVHGYMTEILRRFARSHIQWALEKSDQFVVEERHWFNENLLYIWNIIPSLLGILTMLITLVVTALSVAREREIGTYNQLLVSPLNNLEILLGKTIPAVLIGLMEGLMIIVVAIFIFHIPFTGSLAAYVFALFLFVLSIIFFGLLISSLSSTQQQAILGVFIFMVPAVTLSGYASPIENMPLWLQKFTWFNPLSHFLIVSKGLFLKNMAFSDVWSNSWPLLVISLLILPIAAWLFTYRRN